MIVNLKGGPYDGETLELESLDKDIILTGNYHYIKKNETTYTWRFWRRYATEEGVFPSYMKVKV